jgi:hypothetical protein
MPMRGDKFDKLNLVRQAGVMLAYSVVAGQLIGRTKEAIQNLATGRNDSNYDLFDEGNTYPLLLFCARISCFRISSPNHQLSTN